jgi:hypothetical protein
MEIRAWLQFPDTPGHGDWMSRKFESDPKFAGSRAPRGNPFSISLM